MIYQEWCLVGDEDRENVSVKGDDYVGGGLYLTLTERVSNRKLRLIGLISLDDPSVMLLDFRLLRV